jgi:hypothetical protein
MGSARADHLIKLRNEWVAKIRSGVFFWLGLNGRRSQRGRVRVHVVR